MDEPNQLWDSFRRFVKNRLQSMLCFLLGATRLNAPVLLTGSLAVPPKADPAFNPIAATAQTTRAGSSKAPAPGAPKAH